RDIAGSEESVAAISREAMLDYVGSQYVPANVVVAVAGDLSHDEVIDEVAVRTKGWQSAPHLNWKPTTNGHVGPQTALRSKRTEQAQIGLGYPSYSAFHPDRYALDLLNALMGEGMSSR